MEFLWVTLENFKSFKGEHLLDFRKFAPGLYYMRGVNKKEPSLASNGAGKSTIWDAVFWCFFGVSLRNVKSGNLAPWGQKRPTSVTVCLRVAGSVVKISRSYRPNTLTMQKVKAEPVGITQDQLNDLLRLGPERMQQSVLIGQFTTMFFDLKPEQKLTVFTDLMDLQYWVACSDHAKATAATLQEEYDGLYEQRAILEARMAEITEAVESDRVGLASYERAKQQELKMREADIARMRAELADATRRSKKIVADVDNGAEAVALKGAAWQAMIAEGAEVTDRAVTLERELAKLGVRSELFNKQIAAVDATSDRCPTCGQKVDIKHLKDERRRLQKELDAVESQAAFSVQGLAKLRKSTKVADEKIEEARRVVATAANELNVLRQRAGDAAYQMVTIGDKIKHAEEEMMRLEGEESVLAERIVANAEKLVIGHKELKRVKKGMQEIEPLVTSVRGWVKGFKDVRLFEIDEALQALEVEVNNYLFDLGMENWSIKFEVERETKSGTVSRGFQVLVDPGTGKASDIKPWEAWSGGEGQRLRLAGSLGLSNLILRQRGVETNLQLWDEKLYWLSGTGEEDMLRLLQEHAKRSGKQIWVIDQHALDFPFDGVVTVTKDSKGSRVEW